MKNLSKEIDPPIYQTKISRIESSMSDLLWENYRKEKSDEINMKIATDFGTVFKYWDVRQLVSCVSPYNFFPI